MAGIYIHIPFCKRKCHYCNFFSLASNKNRPEFLNALKNEITLTRNYLSGEPVNTIYFGGGTPSLFRPEILQGILEMLTPPREGGEYQASPLGEITLEINPDDATDAFVAELKHTWFNRFSIGVQSFLNKDLVWLNRSHTADHAIRAVRKLQDAGYGNIGIDLIYGIPSSSHDQWKKNLEIAFSLDVPHISAYALTVESGTPLAWMISKKRSVGVDDESQVTQFRLLMDMARDHGFLQYEISNFAKYGWFAIHNTNYWKGIPYLGLGPSAHSYNGKSRRWNISSLTKYIDRINSGLSFHEEEILTPEQKYNEYVMTSLRTMWGCNTQKMIDDFGFTIYDFFRKTALPLIGRGLLKEDSGVYFLTEDGKLFADGVAAELFLVA
ncbi:MAG: radical SAM family heme chaperone HemW [Bacteroidota bacterium]